MALSLDSFSSVVHLFKSNIQVPWYSVSVLNHLVIVTLSRALKDRGPEVYFVAVSSG